MALTKNLFNVPNNLNANHPIEVSGRARDDVKLMVLDSLTGRTIHQKFHDLVSFIKAGDVLVLNNSRTIPSVLKGKQGKRDIEVRLSRRVTNDSWEVLIVGGLYASDKQIDFSNGITACIEGEGSELPLLMIRFSVSGQRLYEMFYQYGEPIRYEYIETPWPLDAYQTVYASVPGSVEMPSAGRAFTWKLINQLKRKGVSVVFLQLHAGLSYYGNDHWPVPSHHPESYNIPEETARIINDAKKKGNRIIAVGTTVVRTIETVADQCGFVQSGEGITTLYIKKGTPLKCVDGLVTGMHEPEASHLDLLSTLIEKEKLMSAYREAIQKEYLWHEFGDMNLIIPMENNQ
ncbi:S-adenosylmethionine:tRNA ribosyltransferase-isomerase [Bacillus suaedaesalsae]|uniref:S-adenosylmethionine:tRNA ribosyltransferase-isomerase n=1 Tax=Bacillus suaedaesalsae TaxID=2810349 RepID=A0ABS2DEU2_9BACI|nr:S-adenosylmethionine:tRNA ribosyltransferase-isomerase [Bacillus suaedaesalsae]MBM6616530.1 S-adenosylmethionine:tRNA ribosyltransferase-isomerase [Bacillus suaedaesalsae]